MEPDELSGVSQESFLKIVLLGEPGTGKTSLITRYVNERFSGDSVQTSGVEFHRKRIRFPGDREVSLQIWDTGGNAINSPMLTSFLHAANVLVFMYDITNSGTLNKLSHWFTKVDAALKSQSNTESSSSSESKDPPFMALVGTKLDMQHLRAVTTEQAVKFAAGNRIAETTELSARTGENVAVFFRKVTATVLGLRLGKAELEQEILAAQLPSKPTLDQDPIPKPSVTSAKSAVCSIS